MDMKETDDGLDENSRKRLEKLQSEWDATPGKFLKSNLCVPDLRLLLQHHAPLHELIRAIAAAPEEQLPLATTPRRGVQRMQLETSSDALTHTQTQRDTVYAEKQALQQACQQLQDDLQQCNAASHKLLQTKNALQKNLEKVKEELQQEKATLQEVRQQLARTGSPPPQLSWLRQQAGLARRLGLADLPDDDIQALIQTVAVLSQRENLERLWSLLKEDCEATNRTVQTDEQALLVAALSWHNHNWRNKPYQLVQPTAGSLYLFDQHLRSQHTSSGEKIRALHLPGIADGSGRLLCKALVSTC